MSKVVFALLLVALIVIPLVSAQSAQNAPSPQEAPVAGLLSPELLADPSLLTEPLTVPLGNGRFAAYIPVAGPNATQDFTASGDTFAQGVSPNSTHGGDANLELAIYKCSPSRLYVAFNTGLIPSTATVTFARFSLFLVEWNVRSGSVSTELRRVTSYWSSSTVSWNNKPNSSYYSTRGITPSSPSWIDYTCTSLVENYWKGHDYGTGQNLGLELRGPEGSCPNDYGLWFNSKEADGHRPWLYVEYTLPGVTPTVTATPRPSPTPTELPGIGVAVRKEMIAPAANPIILGDEVEFRIRVRNTGDTTLTHIALVDTYPHQCLEYLSAVPGPSLVDPAFDTIRWDNLVDFSGPVPPGGEIVVTVRFRAIHVCPGLWYNCARVVSAIDTQRNQTESFRSCSPFWVEPRPPDVEVDKWFPDPVICEGDRTIAVVPFTNTGGVAISSFEFVDEYNTTYLESLAPVAAFGPDDGHLEASAIIPFPGIQPGLTGFIVLPFRGKLQTPLTTNVARMVVNHYAPSEDSGSADLTILPAAGPCEGNLVLNPGFESGTADWPHSTGLVRTSTLDKHGGARALLQGILPGEADASRLDGLAQLVAIPADAHGATLSFWYRVRNRNDPSPHHNYFEAYFVDVASSTVIGVVPPTAFSAGWQKATVDLTPFIGRQIAIVFQTYNDGDGTGPLWTFVDNVEICVSRCGPPEDVPDPGDGLCWKEAFPDYAPNGMPDFDMKQVLPPDMVHKRYLDGPLAAANCLWWFDSEFETGTTPPPAISDHYPLVQAYNQSWDDHDAQNMMPLAEDLDDRMNTDGGTGAPWSWVGTRPGELAGGVRQYIAAKNLQNEYAVSLVKAPSFDRVQDHVIRCNDVIMLLGFWEAQPNGWRRLGGHWVTAAGVNCTVGDRIAISDPYIDAAEDGFDGVVMPLAGHAPEHAAGVHNDAAYISHDIYGIWRQGLADGSARFGLVDYVRWNAATDEQYPDLEPFYGANIPQDLENAATLDYQGGSVQTRVEYAVIVEPMDDAVRLALQPGTAQAAVGDVVVVDLVVNSRTQTFDSVSAYLDFDPTRLQCVDAAGNPITQVAAQDLTQVMANAVDNTVGAIDLAMRVPLGSPAVNGHVLVAQLYFRALASTPAGGTMVEYNFTEPRMSEVLSGATSVLGGIQELRVVASTPATLQVDVGLEGRGTPPSARWQIPLELSLLDPESGSTVQSYSASTDQSGHMAIAGVPVGTFAIRVKGMHTLANRRLGSTLLPGANIVSMGGLAEGDVDNDNDVDATDASLLNLAFGATPGGAHWDPRADLNEDDMITAADMGLLALHFGQVGDLTVASPAALAYREPDRGLRFGSVVGPTAGNVTLTTSGPASTVALGAVLQLDVLVQAGSQPVDTADVYLTYDTDFLAVVDAAGNPATTVQAGTALANVLANSVDSTNGVVHYAASTSGTGPTGNIKVATLRFKAVLPTTQTRLRFSVSAPQQTAVLYHGDPVLGFWPATTVRVTGGQGLTLPFIARP
jgi:hypothetical protein